MVVHENISSPPIAPAPVRGMASSPPLSPRHYRSTVFLPLCRPSASHSAAPPHRLRRRCALSSTCSAPPVAGRRRPHARRTGASTPERLVPLGTARCQRRNVAGLVPRRNPAMLLPKGTTLEVRSSSRSPSTPPSNSSSFLPRGCLPPPPADPAPSRLGTVRWSLPPLQWPSILWVRLRLRLCLPCHRLFPAFSFLSITPWSPTAVSSALAVLCHCSAR